VQVHGWAIDNEWRAESAIALVEVFVDGVKVGNASAASRPDVCAAYPGRAGCPNVGFSYVWNTSALSIGNHTLQIVATDSDAPTPHTTTLVRTVTTSLPPTVYLDAPMAGATVAGTVQVYGWAIDNEWRAESAIASVQVLVDGVPAGFAIAVSRPDVCAAYPGRAGCPNVGFSYLWNTSGLSAGSHTLGILATDSDAGTPHTTLLNRTVIK
jgi:hypothetical protein